MGQGGALPDVPFAWLEQEPEPIVGGAFFFSATVAELLDAALSDRFVWVDGMWCIDNLDAMNAAAQAERERNASIIPARPQRGRRR